MKIKTIFFSCVLAIFGFSGNYTVQAQKKALINPPYNKTYKVSGTECYYGEQYESTGKPKVKRSAAARSEFLKSKGYSKVPAGYNVDHIIPLSQGGRDVTSNMQLITIQAHKQKTALERKRMSSKNYYSTPKSSAKTYNMPTYNCSAPKQPIFIKLRQTTINQKLHQKDCTKYRHIITRRQKLRPKTIRCHHIEL
ncbi:HNH endonuclease signature motif containing protein [Parapedobacter defluvii]|uniref:HNH endonuclease signature motif containing protein n=1 Tax=Parapedobacter defluvii TaxID=2045106 RepID=UPI001664C0C6|nr:HNH endonuclease signature motif containing protein [Parapedobacter defluvii]